jgi:dolichol kinase
VEKPIIGIESVFFSILTAMVLILYAILFLPIVKRSFKIKSKTRYNSLLVIVLLVVIAIFLALPFSDTVYYLYMPMNWYFIVVVGSVAIAFVLVAGLSQKSTQEKEFRLTISEGMDETLERSILDTYKFTPKQEFYRKIFHLMAILYIATWVLQPVIFWGVDNLYTQIPNTISLENFGNAKLLFEDTNVEILLMNGLVTHFFMLLCIFIGNANTEIMRLRFDEYNTLLKKTLQKTRRATELNDLSASLLLLLGLAVSSLVLTYGSDNRIAGVYAQMGVICIAVFSDMFAALIGRKWGKHKWKIVPGKSYEGSIAGFLIGFITATIFVGPLLAFIGSCIFVFTDIALDKVKICDNALNPLLISIVFKIFITINPLLVMNMIEVLPFIRVW